MKLHFPLEFRNTLEVRLQEGNWCDVMNLSDLSIADQQELLKNLGHSFSFMPESRPELLTGFKEIYLKHPLLETVTFFGGSFYPFHAGHLNCLVSCPEKNIVVVPDNNPFKVTLEKPQPLKTFYDLCKILKDKPYSIYPGFLGKSTPNPTAEWISKVKMQEVNFLMGDDSFMSFFKWTRPEEIIKALTKLYVVPRDFEKSDYETQIKKMQAINPALQIIILPDHPFRKLSSTSFR